MAQDNCLERGRTIGETAQHGPTIRNLRREHHLMKTWESTIRQARSALEWLERRSIRARGGRLEAAIRSAEAFVNDGIATERDHLFAHELTAEHTRGIHSLLDVMELVDIFQAFGHRSTPNDDIQETLRILARGDPTWVEETERNNDPRNRAFELRLGAAFSMAGYSPRFRPNDVVLDDVVGAPGMAFECKRLGGIKNLQWNLEYAAHQLEDSSDDVQRYKRLVALDISRLDPPLGTRGVWLHAPSSRAALDEVKLRASSFVRDNLATIDALKTRGVDVVFAVFLTHALVPRPTDGVRISERLTWYAFRPLNAKDETAEWLTDFRSRLGAVRNQ